MNVLVNGEAAYAIQMPIEFPPHEEWRDVPEWEDLYQISDLGRVRAKKSRLRGHYQAGDIIKTRFNRSGYETVVLCRKQGSRTVFVHHLVAFAFIGDRPEGQEVNHKDEVKANNRLTNLEYMTHGQNIRYSLARLTEDQVREIRRRAANGETSRQLSEAFGVTPANIWQIHHRRIWRYLDES